MHTERRRSPTKASRGGAWLIVIGWPLLNEGTAPIMRRVSRAFKLFRLQQVDSELDSARGRIAEIDQILGEDEAMRRAEAAHADATNVQAEAERELRQAEAEVLAQQAKIEQNQSTLYSGSVTNPKELQDLQLEAEALKRHLATLEDAQLEKMLSLESATSDLSDARKHLDALRAEKAKEHGELGEERQRLEAEAARLEDERVAAASGVPDADMAAYNKLRKSKGGLAVAKVNSKMCGACGATLSDALAQAARSPNELSTCSSCRRILYSG